LGCTVLIVDTDIKVLHNFAQVLRAAGYLVFEASSYEEGKRLWREIIPEVLVVDVRLGQFNGLQLLMRARSDRPDLKCIITCPFADPVLEAETHRFGGIFLIKPIAPQQIVNAIGNASRPNPVVPDPVTPPLLLERRRIERRVTETPGIWPERRVGQRRATTMASDQQSPAPVPSTEPRPPRFQS
jgi:ActR/RegA family two-component response regulator